MTEFRLLKEALDTLEELAYSLRIAKDLSISRTSAKNLVQWVHNNGQREGFWEIGEGDDVQRILDVFSRDDGLPLEWSRLIDDIAEAYNIPIDPNAQSDYI